MKIQKEELTDLAGKKKKRYEPAMDAAGAPIAPRRRRFIVFLLSMSGTIAGAPAADRTRRRLLVLPDLSPLAIPWVPCRRAPPVLTELKEFAVLAAIFPRISFPPTLIIIDKLGVDK